MLCDFNIALLFLSPLSVMFMENISRMKSIIWATPCGAWGSYFLLYAWGLLPAVLGTH